MAIIFVLRNCPPTTVTARSVANVSGQCRQRRVQLTCARTWLHRASSSPSHLRGKLLVGTHTLRKQWSLRIPKTRITGFRCPPFYSSLNSPLIPIKSLISRLGMVLPPYDHPFLCKLCVLWSSDRPWIRPSRLDARRLPHFRAVQFWPCVHLRLSESRRSSQDSCHTSISVRHVVHGPCATLRLAVPRFCFALHLH